MVVEERSVLGSGGIYMGGHIRSIVQTEGNRSSGPALSKIVVFDLGQGSSPLDHPVSVSIIMFT